MCPDHHSRSVTGVEPNRGCRLSWINTSAALFDDETSVYSHAPPQRETPRESGVTLHSLVSVGEILSDSRCKMELLPDPPMKPFKTEVAFAFTNEKNH